MIYTMQSAQWGNSDHSSAVIVTEESGAVAISAVDTPREWAEFIEWAKGNVVVDEPALPPQPTKQQKFDRWLSSIGATAEEIKAMLGVP
jgi:hypothetical protein